MRRKKDTQTVKDPNLRLCARMWLNLNGKPFLGAGKIKLLKAVEETGSISAASRRLRLSYRTAWNRIDAMNNLAGAPLVTTNTGGEKGGGAQLTDLGRGAIESYATLEKELEKFRRKVQKSVLKNFQDIPALDDSDSKDDESK